MDWLGRKEGMAGARRDSEGVAVPTGSSLINGDRSLQGQHGQQGLRLEVLEDHIPLITMMT